MLRIAHVSDLHVLSPRGVALREVLFDKRVTGYVNLLTKRGRVYRHEHLVAVLEAAAAEADHVVVTGDITNLSLEHEYEEAVKLLEALSQRVEVTVVPGNHDVYLPAIHRERRFVHHFAELMGSDLPELAVDLPAGRFPSVKLRGPAAIIGLSSAVPRPPFVSAGVVGKAQLEALGAVLAHPEVRGRTPVVLIHHGPFDALLRFEQLRGGLVDARALRRALQPVTRGVLLHGHIHVRQHGRLGTSDGWIDVVSATAAPLEHAADDVRAGYNLISLHDDGRIASIEGRVLDLRGRAFRSVPVTATAAAP